MILVLKKVFSINRNYTDASSLSDRAAFPGFKGEFSTNLDFIYPENNTQIGCYRVMNRKGVVLDPSQDPQVFYSYNLKLKIKKKI